MKYVLEVNVPNRPQGSLIEVSGFGTFKNGSAGEIDPDLVELYRLNNRKLVEKDDPDNEGKKVQVWEDPLTPDKLSWQEGVTCRVLKKGEQFKPPAEPTDQTDEGKKKEGGNQS